MWYQYKYFCAYLCKMYAWQFLAIIQPDMILSKDIRFIIWSCKASLYVRIKSILFPHHIDVIFQKTVEEEIVLEMRTDQNAKKIDS